MPVLKKDGRVRIYVDYRDLNKACPKDYFSLPHIDVLIDNAAPCAIYSFMDGFSRYNQILMAIINKAKMSFITEWDTYCYRIMPFGLKNTGATYQRMATAMFHDMMHKEVEVYIDDMMVKCETREGHPATLEKFLIRVEQYILRLNPKKCVFRVTSSKMLGYIVSQNGIKVDLDKVKVIREMPELRIEKEIIGFLRKLQFISRFITKLIVVCEPIFKLLKKDQPVIWNE